MDIKKNLPLFLNLCYYGFNRGLRQTSGARGDFEPIFNEDGTVRTTYCNLFLDYVCRGLGYMEFEGKMANEIDAYMSDPKNGWIVVDDAVAQSHANAGVLVVASKSNPGSHGHVCLILPGVLEKSASWGKSVPKCVNVGKDVFFGKKVSFAFTVKDIPRYFALGSMV